MAEKYFKCDPLNLCEGATCCRSIDTKVSLSLGDYLRLSEYTDEPIKKIWREKGDITLMSFPELRRGEFLLTLGLLHDPCPYLSKENKCEVYEIRPIGCANFPLFLYIHKPEQLKENYKNYRCLKDVQPRSEQIELEKELDQIVEEEAKLDFKHLWYGKEQYIYAPSPREYFLMAAEALLLQGRRDPRIQLKRTQRLMNKIERMKSLVESGESEKGIIADLYVDLLSPVVFSILEDVIAERLKSLDSETLKSYEKTTELYKQLNSKID